MSQTPLPPSKFIDPNLVTVFSFAGVPYRLSDEHLYIIVLLTMAGIACAVMGKVVFGLGSSSADGVGASGVTEEKANGASGKANGVNGVNGSAMNGVDGKIEHLNGKVPGSAKEKEGEKKRVKRGL